MNAPLSVDELVNRINANSDVETFLAQGTIYVRNYFTGKDRFADSLRLVCAVTSFGLISCVVSGPPNHSQRRLSSLSTHGASTFAQAQVPRRSTCDGE